MRVTKFHRENLCGMVITAEYNVRYMMLLYMWTNPRCDKMLQNTDLLPSLFVGDSRGDNRAVRRVLTPDVSYHMLCMHYAQAIYTVF